MAQSFLKKLHFTMRASVQLRRCPHPHVTLCATYRINIQMMTYLASESLTSPILPKTWPRDYASENVTCKHIHRLLKLSRQRARRANEPQVDLRFISDKGLAGSSGVMHLSLRTTDEKIWLPARILSISSPLIQSKISAQEFVYPTAM